MSLWLTAIVQLWATFANHQARGGAVFSKTFNPQIKIVPQHHAIEFAMLL